MNDQVTKYWLDLADKDLKTAKHLYLSKDYHWCLFVGHIVLEKTLKAYFANHLDGDAPYSHNLVNLAEKCKLELSEEQLELLEVVSDFNIEARYPDLKLSFIKKCSKRFTGEYLKKIEEFYKWLIQKIKE